MEFSLLAILFLGLLFDFTNGFHDAANVVSTVIATKTLTARKAVVLAGIFNILGALVSSAVAQTIAKDLINVTSATHPLVICALLGAISWNFITWYFGLPSSSSAALIGGLIGSSWYSHGIHSIVWEQVGEKVLAPMLISPILGFILAYAIMGIYYRIKRKEPSTEKKLRALQLISSMFVSLSHGMNDAQKSMGVITLGLFLSGFIEAPLVPKWVILVCALTMGLGTAIGGFRIIRTVGYRITKLSVAQGFAAELSTASTVFTGSYLGMPISSTHVVVGAVTGAGAAKSIYAVHWRLWQRFCLAWFVTAPSSALIAIVFLNLFSFVS